VLAVQLAARPGHSLRCGLALRLWLRRPSLREWPERCKICFHKPTVRENRSSKKPIPLICQIGHEKYLFFPLHFSGAPISEGSCFQSERLLYGREPDGVG
jgi:hypothetical protein